MCECKRVLLQTRVKKHGESAEEILKVPERKDSVASLPIAIRETVADQMTTEIYGECKQA